MRIACDIDGCINNLVDKTLEMYNAETGKNIQISDITAYNFYDCLPKDDADGIIRLFQRKDLWDSLSPAHNSQKGLKTLINRGYKVYLTTATDPNNFAYKTEWLCAYFPFIDMNNVIRIMDKSLLNVDIIIDDCIDNLKKSMCERIVIDHPWNQGKSTDYTYDIHRAYDFRDVINIIDEIERRDKEWENNT